MMSDVASRVTQPERVCNDGAAFLRCKNAATLHRPTFEQKLQIATRTRVMLGDGTNRRCELATSVNKMVETNASDFAENLTRAQDCARHRRQRRYVQRQYDNVEISTLFDYLHDDAAMLKESRQDDEAVLQQHVCYSARQCCG
jgi:hypothetical protein